VFLKFPARAELAQHNPFVSPKINLCFAAEKNIFSLLRNNFRNLALLAKNKSEYAK